MTLVLVSSLPLLGIVLSLPLISLWMQGHHQLALIRNSILKINSFCISSFFFIQVWLDNLGASQLLWRYVTYVIILPPIWNAQTRVWWRAMSLSILVISVGSVFESASSISASAIQN